METRKIKKTYKSHATLEGAGVHLKRAFGYNEVPLFDPFLMLDDFRLTDPEKYEKGFPWHPHRGIETITYILEGEVEHQDSLGNRGIISSGDVQWMTAGSGIIHQEMPVGDKDGKMFGFQLWANLPSAQKMMQPRYQEIKSSDIPIIVTGNGIRIRVICGKVNQTSGPVKDIVAKPEFLDISIPANTTFLRQFPADHTVFAYVIGGDCFFPEDKMEKASNETLVLFSEGAQVLIETKEESARLLLLSGKPLNEPIAWGGPIVMNSQDELQLAFDEYQNGTFIK
jgi:redox-sensitive bicupin YhaK (pirin superfamily)